MKKMPTLYEKLMNDPRVEELVHEGPNFENCDGGWWLTLMDGYLYNGSCIMHEGTLETLWNELNSSWLTKAPDPTDLPGCTK